MTIASRVRASAFCLAIAAALPLTAALASGQASAPPARVQDTATASAEEARLDREARALSSELRCPVCQGESIEESRSDIAAEMRAFVRAKLAEGNTPDQIKDMLVASYGEWVLLSPRPEGFNLAVYLLPIAMLLGGAVLVMHLTRRWTGKAGGQRPTLDEEDPDLAAWDPDETANAAAAEPPAR